MLTPTLPFNVRAFTEGEQDHGVWQPALDGPYGGDRPDRWARQQGVVQLSEWHFAPEVGCSRTAPVSLRALFLAYSPVRH
jgi:hypothetical protein